ncbi:MAG: carboxypeptidase-like regulatory domain-containing protein [Parasphingorhabdus sp.]|nr:carboxypeptidase-like regulatory domain-containing protein [Parasphingorhabdus sp.]
MALAACLLPMQIAQAENAGWRANSDDALLFDLRADRYRLGDGIRGYQTSAGVCVDLADMILALDIPIRLDKKSRRATGWIFTEDQTLVIDREKNTVQTMNKERSLEPAVIHDTPEGWCVSTITLASWLDVRLKPDLANAVLRIEADRKLPFLAAIERQERAAKIRPSATFDLASLPQSRESYKYFRMPSVDAVVSAGGLRESGRQAKADLRYDLFASGEIAKASFDARLSSDNKGAPNSLRLRAYRTDPGGKLLGPLRATHFALGDVASLSTALVAQNVAGRGALVTNRPVERPDSFDRTSFRGELPTGWDAELYRNGQLLAFATKRSDGRYEFLDVPLLYGQNRFEVVLYGPQGQVRREVRVVPVGQDSIPPRKTFYWAGISEAGRDLIHLGGFTPLRQAGWRGGLALERGLDAKTSIATSLFSLKIDGQRQDIAEASVRRALGPTLFELSGSANTTGGTAFRAQLLGELGRTYITAESIWAQGGFLSDRVERNVTAEHRLAFDQQLKLGTLQMPFHIDAQYQERRDGRSSFDLTTRTSLNLRRLSLTGELNWERSSFRGGPDPPDRLEAALLMNGRVGRVRLRGEARYRLSPDPRFRKIDLIGEWNAGRRADWRAEFGYDAELSRARAGIGYIRHFDKFSLSTNAEVASDGSVAGGLNLNFSFGPDPRGGGYRFSDNKLAANGQALALVFRDDNGDGIRQPNEKVEKNVELTAGQSIALTPTDDQGLAIIDNLEPFRPILIGIDASSLPDPYVQPALPGVVVTPRPGIAARVELPLVSAGEVEGTLLRQGGSPLAGVKLELLDAKGRIAKTTRTEFDGYFLFEGVPYGRYGIRIEKLSADAVNVPPELAVAATVNGAEPVARAGIVVAGGKDALAAAGP